MSETWVVDMGDEDGSEEPLVSSSDARPSFLRAQTAHHSEQRAFVPETASTDTERRRKPAKEDVPSTSKTKEPLNPAAAQSSSSGQIWTTEEKLFLAVLDKNHKEFKSIINKGLTKNLINKRLQTKTLTENKYFNMAMVMPYRRAHNGFLFSCEYICTTLHFAAAFALHEETLQLLAAGADPNAHDGGGRTVLDVVGTGLCYIKTFELQLDDNAMSNLTQVIRLIHQHGGLQGTMLLRKRNFTKTTPLHSAALLENTDAFKELIQLGAHPGCFNVEGETPLHICAKNKYEEPFKILDKKYKRDMSEIIDLTESRTGTVLHEAIRRKWRIGVICALTFGADVTKESSADIAPIHTAAVLGDLDILNDILHKAKEKGCIDYKNKRGETALFLAVFYGNVACVESILEIQDRDYKLLEKINGMNVLHVAAKHGDEKTLRLLCDSGQVRINAFRCLSVTGFGPLHYAASENNIDCVKLLLVHNRILIEGSHNLYGPITEDERPTDDQNTIRLKTGKDETMEEVNSHKSITSKKKATVIEGSTALHIAAMYNYTEIAAILLRYDKLLIHEKNVLNELPLHTAIVHSSRDVTKVLIKNGASFASCFDDTDGTTRTAINMLINNLSDPEQFLNDVFDSYISTNDKNLDEPDCIVEIDYSSLMPNDIISTPHESEMKQMKILQALLDTGNRYQQQSLLMHPLVESFLHLKWKALLPFFYTIIALYAFFLISLTLFSYSVFYYKDTNDFNITNTNNEELIPVLLNTKVWAIVMYFFIILIILQESLLNIHFSIRKLVSGLREMTIRQCLEHLRAISQEQLSSLRTKSRSWCLQLLQLFTAVGVETWTKWASIGMAFILPFTTGLVRSDDAQWMRNLATFALPMAWIHMMILISRFPSLGYYVLMFGRVTRKVIKILLTFSFLLFGFSIGFAIQFRFQTPFDGPVSAFIKTFIMMTSEFDYGSIFDEEHIQKLEAYQVTARIIFSIFVVLAAIVLMNLMVGVAVSDTSILERDGHIQRLKRQVKILVVLENLAKDHPWLTKLFGIEKGGNINRVITLSPGKKKAENDKLLPKEIQDNIFAIAQTNYKKKRDVKEGDNDTRKAVDVKAEIFKHLNDTLITTISDKVMMEIAKLSRKLDNKYPPLGNVSEGSDYRRRLKDQKESTQ